MDPRILIPGSLSMLILGSFLGILIGGCVLLIYIYRFTRSRMHLATLIFSLGGLFFVTCELLLVLAFFLNNPVMGRQFHRLQALASAFFLALIPLLVRSMTDLSPPMKKLNTLMSAVAAALVAFFVFVAFAFPELYVSVERQMDPTALYSLRWPEMRGATGPLYRVRDIALLIFIPYILAHFVFVSRSKVKYVILPSFGAVMVIFCGLTDFILFYMKIDSLALLYSLPSFTSLGVVVFVILSLVAVVKRYQDETRELEKVSRIKSLGILSGGIAHDFNNLLTSVLGYISLIRESGGSEAQNLSFLSKAEAASLRAKDLASQLLAFSRGGTPLKTVQRPVDLISGSTSIIPPVTGVKLELSLASNLKNMLVDKTQITQVLQNIFLNAAQAMPGGGRLSVSAQNIHLGSRSVLPLARGDYVKIVIKDSGSGIKKQDLEKLFDPFFSSKGQGHGLGLAIVYKIIHSHEGHISVDSIEGDGTTFTLYLPASNAQVLAEKEEKTTMKTAAGRILYMEDEEMVAEVGKKMFCAAGFEVDLCANGDEAIDLFVKARQSQSPYSFLVLDILIKNGRGGVETIRELKRIDPMVIAVATSGYADENVVGDYRHYGFASFLQKPFQLKDVRKLAADIVQLK